MNITLIGNCQAVALCFYLQQLLPTENYNVYWLLYAYEFKQHLGSWSIKCKNKLTDYSSCIEQIKKSDIIIYQEISKSKSSFANTDKLRQIKKESCKLIVIPAIHIDYNNYDEYLAGLREREKANNVDIVVSDIFDRYSGQGLMLSTHHPTTLLFLEIMKRLCTLLNIKYFSDRQAAIYLQNPNYMELPS